MFKIGERVLVDMMGFSSGGVAFPGSGSTMVGIVMAVLHDGLDYEVELPLTVNGQNRFVFPSFKLQPVP